jgi:hypothetical protein
MATVPPLEVPIVPVLETTTLPSSGIYINVDVNELLDRMTEGEMFELLGKLKDLFDA